jgi:hypothetical protein
MLDIQYIFAAMIIIGAVALAGRSIYRRTRSLAGKNKCDTGCGCSGTDTGGSKSQ